MTKELVTSNLVAYLRDNCICGDRASHAGPHRCVYCKAADMAERLTAELCGANAAHDLRATRQADEINRLRAALEKIKEGTGPFNRDQLKFAENVIEEMKGIAREALNGDGCL